MANTPKDIVKTVVYGSSDSALSDDDKILLNSVDANSIIDQLIKAFSKGQVYSKEKVRAFRAILSIRSIDTVKVLLDIFPKAPIDWKTAICAELEAFPEPRVIAAMRDILLTAKNPNVRYAAAGTLAKIGDTTAIAALEYAEQHDKGRDFEGRPVAEEAGYALQRIRKRISKVNTEVS